MAAPAAAVGGAGAPAPDPAVAAAPGGAEAAKKEPKLTHNALKKFTTNVLKATEPCMSRVLAWGWMLKQVRTILHPLVHLAVLGFRAWQRVCGVRGCGHFFC